MHSVVLWVDREAHVFTYSLPDELVTIFIAVIQCLTRNHLIEEGLILAYSLRGHSSSWWRGMALGVWGGWSNCICSQEAESRGEESSSHTPQELISSSEVLLRGLILARDQVFQHMNMWGIFHIQTTTVCLFASVPAPHLVFSPPFAPAALWWSGDVLFCQSTHQWGGGGVFLIPFWTACLSS